MTEREARTAAELAIGRILRLGSRPFQEGDIELFDEARAVLLEAAAALRAMGRL